MQKSIGIGVPARSAGDYGGIASIQPPFRSARVHGLADGGGGIARVLSGATVRGLSGGEVGGVDAGRDPDGDRLLGASAAAGVPGGTPRRRRWRRAPPLQKRAKRMPARKAALGAFKGGGARQTTPPWRSSAIWAAAFRHQILQQARSARARKARRLAPPLPRWPVIEATRGHSPLQRG